VKFWEVC